ncbi:MAG: alpha-ketoglutarate-dependent dioxygenase AlkB [Candidatus Sericytochromatia bacterium]|nr:alpha-ketoglutarate-dependent dioxygenase AlkB [Candidatus Sericytochromatia bacterium]
MTNGQQMSLFSGLGPRHLNLPDATIWYQAGFIAPFEARGYFERLQAHVAWRSEHLVAYGKQMPIPRLTAWYGDPGAFFTYSRIHNSPLDWTDDLTKLRCAVEQATQHRFNGVLLNLYRDGTDSIAWHSDNEREFGEQPVIASLTFGATRKFRLRHKSREDLEVVELPLEDGSLLVMAGETQRHWEHEIRKSKTVTGPRINLTFRLVLTR